jgi:hypothetical protein
MMVLGPPPEFCMESAGDVDLPADMLAEAISRVPI